ncbi:MAG TPA: periplasmic heavy metal sensor [Syntrophales bacterium]|jgi:Spy/CpxP family protein refolding chaperone|nr:periplasmic heavy metal sensor [Syntrophales bacterium]HRT62532.1 periplasmic heavy metal sensor [Syntrophales bacterium]
MKGVSFIQAFCLLLLALAAGPVGAQAQGQEQQAVSGRVEISLKALKLTDEQMKAAREIKASYTKRLLKLRGDIIAKRIEFRDLLRDPSATEDMIRAKGKEIEAMDVQLVREMIEFEIEMRKILTPEQVHLWCNYMDPSSVRKVRK